MAVVGDVIRLTPYGRNNGEYWEVNFTYRVKFVSVWTGNIPLFGFAQKWAEQFAVPNWGLIDDIISNNVDIIGVRAFNLFSFGEVGEHVYATPLIGANTDACLAPEICYKYRHPQGRRGMNPGFKSFPGVVLEHVNDGGFVDSVALAAMNSFVDFMNSDINILTDDSLIDVDLEPIVVGSFREGTGSPSSPYKYRLPKTQAEMGVEYYLAQNWSPITTTSTANSRKYGRGA